MKQYKEQALHLFLVRKMAFGFKLIGIYKIFERTLLSDSSRNFRLYEIINK